MAVRYGDISLASSWRAFTGNKSGLVAFAGLSFCSSIVTPSFEAWTYFMAGMFLHLVRGCVECLLESMLTHTVHLIYWIYILGQHGVFHSP